MTIERLERKMRASNMDLLRIIAMFFVLLIHANFWAVLPPTVDEIVQNPVDAWIRTFFESAGVIAVHCFIFISGWFGINFKLKGLANFLYQSTFFRVGATAIMLMLGTCSLDKAVAMEMTMASDWFIMSYLVLLMMAPVLNAFIENTSRSKYRLLLFLYFGYIFSYGLYSGSVLHNGYSPLFFFGIYLLVRYIRIYRPKLANFPIYVDLLVYIFCTLAMTVLFCRFNISCYAYVNPLIVVSSIYFSLIFTKFEFKSKLVNGFAASSFAAYLLHTTPGLKTIYQACFKNLHETNTISMFWMKTVAVIIAIMIVAAMIDQLRIASYKGVMKYVGRRSPKEWKK